MIECTCKQKGAATWHEDWCPWFQHQCEDCEGMGTITVPAGCGCCSDIETCEYCKGTGLASEVGGSREPAL